MNHDAPAYGLWLLVLVNSAVFIMFAFSFFKPQTSRDWRTFGTFAAFIVALFVEMYGFPLTLYVLSGWLQTKYPSLDLLSHNSGHLWSTRRQIEIPRVVRVGRQKRLQRFTHVVVFAGFHRLERLTHTAQRFSPARCEAAGASAGRW